MTTGVRYYALTNVWKSRGLPNIDPSGGGVPDPLDKPGFTLVLDEQFTGSTVNGRWTVYDASNGNATFGAPTRIQRYQTGNVTVGAGSAGATGNTSMKLRTFQTDNGTGTLPDTTTAGTRYSYTSGMVDSRSSSVWYPRYGWYEWRVKLPHGQGLWPALWLVAKSGGSNMAEYDIVEYFHAQLPGKNSSTIHGSDNTGTFHLNRYTNNGSGGVNPRTFFENPTYTPGWHTWAGEIVPVTDSTGNTLADPTQPSSNVRLRVFVDGVQKVQFVDTSALYYTTNGGTADSYWNVFMQGCQVDGPVGVCHPQSAIGYDHWKNACANGGTPPNSCATVIGGLTVQRAQFGDPASTTEVDYFRCYKFTG